MDVRRLDEMQAQGRSIFDTELAVAYYARVSTDKDEQINSLGNQKRYFEDYITANPHWTFAGGYVDEGISGTSVEGREQFLKMIEDAKRGRFDLIVTKEISRFARNTLDSLRYTRELLRCGVGVYFQNDNINTFDKDAELRLTIMSSIAQDEVRKLSERTRFGFKRAQENSVLLGQNNLFGYNKVDGRLEIVEPEAAVVREVFERYAAGDLGLRAIANDLDSRGVRGRQGKPLTYSTLYGMIRNPKYKGCYAGRRYASRDYRDKRSYRLSADKWLVHKDDRVPAIVPEALWEQANRLLASRGKTMKAHAQASQNRYAYSGKLICARHGTTFHRHVYKSKSRGEAECWNCKLYREKGKTGGCNSPTVYSHELDRILERVFEQITNERSAAVQEYIDNLRAFAAQQDNAPALAQVEQEIEADYAEQRRILHIVGIFTLVAILISALGLVAMSTYYIQQKEQEVAVRKVFGSTRGEVLVRLVGNFMRLVGAAFVLAVPVAWYLLERWLQDYSVRISLSPLIFLIPGAFAAAVAFVAVFWQSSRAADSNPVDSIKN